MEPELYSTAQVCVTADSSSLAETVQRDEVAPSAGWVETICRCCGKPFGTWRSYLKRRPGGPFCSRRCFAQAGRHDHPCRHCGGAIRCAERYCSPACRDRYRFARAVVGFETRVERTAECWLWRGIINPQTGYGQTHRLLGGSAHRASWRIHRGEIPKGLCVLHRCDNPPCVNPDHLFLGTMRDNTQDAIAKGRHHGWRISGRKVDGSPALAPFKRTHCQHSHALTPDNIYTYRGSRLCRVCASDRARRYYVNRQERLRGKVAS